MLIQDWLRNLDYAPKTKGSIKALMHRLFEKAMLWELVPIQRNPVELVEVKGITRRTKKPFPSDPYKTMVVVAICLGLRVSEILALKWDDVDFKQLTMRVTRNGKPTAKSFRWS
jgi:integrase